MQSLPLPNTINDDLEVVRKLSEKAEWTPLIEQWLDAYRSYHQNSGNPFSIGPEFFGDGVADRQYDLYDSRKRSGVLKRMRQWAGLLSCPVCGSPVTGQLDHYLPRTVYPEFSIMRMNLVPACSHCNSGVKGSTVHGTAPERFIQPYFDAWASQALWTIEFNRPLEAATFSAIPIDGLTGDQEAIVRFHLENVLGDQFHRSMANEWSTYPRQLVMRRPMNEEQDVADAVAEDLRVAVASKGNNSWHAAFFRGLADDAEVIEYIYQECQTLVLP